MPVSYNSAARNLFLLGSSGQQVAQNFFKYIDKENSVGDGYISTEQIKYFYDDDKYVIAGSGRDLNLVGYGFFDKRNYDQETDPENPTTTLDYETRIVSTNPNPSTGFVELFGMHVDSNGDLIVCGHVDGTSPWIAKYNYATGVLDWQSSTFTGNIQYTSVTSDVTGYYACGSSTVTGETVVEKYDLNGNPVWGKKISTVGGSSNKVTLRSISANSRGQVVAVGNIVDLDQTKGYMVKITTDGDYVWDKSLQADQEEGGWTYKTRLTDIHVDDKDQLFVSGNLQVTSGGARNGDRHGWIGKFTAEGNLIWQKQTVNGSGTHMNHRRVSVDNQTEQVIVVSEWSSLSDEGISLSKYSKSGKLLWRRSLISDSSSFIDNPVLDADSSFYYISFIDENYVTLSNTPYGYVFGKVSTSGNGLGNFDYPDGSGSSHNYAILNITDEIGRLDDGSVRFDSSDLRKTPFSANHIMFDDYSTQVSKKKINAFDAGVMQYSGSPAIRVADFQELNLGTETTSTTITTPGVPVNQAEFTTAGTFSWTAPTGVTSVSVVAVGGGGGGYDVTGGGGGGLGYKNNITVVPGQSYTVVVGDKGVQSAYPESEGEDSYFINATTVKGGGGIGGGSYQPPGGGTASAGNGSGGDYVGDGGGNGGDGGSGGGSGGGGAGGYSGDGGDGGDADANGSNGSGGGGGGGGGGSSQSHPNYAIGGSGGGVGILGEGTSGSAGTYTQGSSTGGTGGSGGNDGFDGEAAGACASSNQPTTEGLYGGGGASGNNGNCAKRGAPGVVRIIWGTGRSFPSNLTADQTASSGGSSIDASYQVEIRESNGLGAEQAWASSTDGASEVRYFQATHNQHTVVLYSIGADGKFAKYDNVYVSKVNPGKAASNFTPQVGDDRQVTFEGVTKIDTENYFYLPTGDTITREATGTYNAGTRAVYHSAEGPTSTYDTIEYLTIATLGSVDDFGDLRNEKVNQVACSSDTRGLFASGYTPSPASGNNFIDFVTIMSTGNALDFGDLSFVTYVPNACSNQTRGIFAGGAAAPSFSGLTNIDYVTIASKGNGRDFGDLTQQRHSLSGVSSPTRGVFSAGNANPSSNLNNIDYITIASTGNAQDFGDIGTGRAGPAGASSAIRGLFAGGYNPSVLNSIDFITIATTGNTQDFGDLTGVRRFAGGTSSSTRGIFIAGYSPSATNTIDFVSIQTTGNATDFGDTTINKTQSSACSNGHGGLG